MGKHHINQSATSTASPDAVWALLSDVTTWASWAPFDASELESPAPSGDPNGVGAHRCFRMKRRTTREEVVAFEPGSHFAYELRSGIRGVRDYRADVTLAPLPNGGTEIAWRSTFDAPFGTGWLVVAGLGRFIGQVARALASAAEGHPARQTAASD
jgi:hypothetical protein